MEKHRGIQDFIGSPRIVHKLSAFMRQKTAAEGYASIQDFVAHALVCSNSRCSHVKRAQSAASQAEVPSSRGTPRTVRKTSLPECAELETKSTQHFELMARTQAQMLSAVKDQPKKKEALIRDYLGQKADEKQAPIAQCPFSSPA